MKKNNVFLNYVTLISAQNNTTFAQKKTSSHVIYTLYLHRIKYTNF